MPAKMSLSSFEINIRWLWAVANRLITACTEWLHVISLCKLDKMKPRNIPFLHHTLWPFLHVLVLHYTLLCSYCCNIQTDELRLGWSPKQKAESPLRQLVSNKHQLLPPILKTKETEFRLGHHNSEESVEKLQIKVKLMLLWYWSWKEQCFVGGSCPSTTTVIFVLNPETSYVQKKINKRDNRETEYILSVSKQLAAVCFLT